MQKKTFNIYDHDNQAVQDAYSVLATNIHFCSEKETNKTIAVASCIPGVGKTTLAINLAISMAQAGWKVLLVDGDMRKPVVAKRLNNELTYGLSDHLLGKVELADAVSKTNVDGLTYLSCGKNYPNPISLLCSSNFEKFAHEIKNEYDFTIFDTPAMSSVVDGSLIAAKVDAVLLTAEVGLTKTTTLKRAIDQLEKANARILGVVLNKVSKKDYMKYFESYDYFFDEKKFIRKIKIKNAKPVMVNKTLNKVEV